MSAQWQEQAMPIDAGVSLINGDASDLLLCGAAPLARGEFLHRVRALAARLPDAPFVINLCERRDHFIIGFCAALLRGQVTLLPPSRAAGMVDDVAKLYPGSYRLGDAFGTLSCDVRVDDAGPAHAADIVDRSATPLVPAGQLAMIGFTSGSTGAPSANPKTWGALVPVSYTHLDVYKRQASSCPSGPRRWPPTSMMRSSVASARAVIAA